MKVAVLGGSFNPIHIGHLALADDVCKTFGYDKVLFIPALNPPHKEMNDAASAHDRLTMVQAACEGDGRFAAEGCELERGGVSYTYDTICYLEEKYRGQLEGKIGLIMGSDLLENFHLWHKAAELAEKCDLILARRPAVEENGMFSNKAIGAFAMNHSAGAGDGYDGASSAGATKSAGQLADPLFAHALVIENPLLSISSTDIRARIAQGKSFRYLVPSAVFKYISNGKLYGYK
jgi:nicotinate-nucleotide adenylyltransferase